MNKAMEKKLRKKRVPANMYSDANVDLLHKEITGNRKSGCANHTADCRRKVRCSVCLFSVGNGEGKALFAYWVKHKYKGVQS